MRPHAAAVGARRGGRLIVHVSVILDSAAAAAAARLLLDECLSNTQSSEDGCGMESVSLRGCLHSWTADAG
jgi:hypothetical protein